MDEDFDTYSLDPEKGIDASYDLDKLRENALSRIQKYSGNVWTDHNVHDAGIAILEQLCFAIADISYQFGQIANFDALDDILKQSPFFQQNPSERQQTRINLKDFTQALLEHPGIYKVFYIPSISNPTVKGLFDIVVFTEADADKSDIDYFLETLRDSWRPLCSAFQGFHFPPDRKIEINLSVEVNNPENVQQIIDDYHEEMLEFLRGKSQNENLTHFRIISINNFSDKVNFEIQSADLIARLNAVNRTKNIKDVSIKDPDYDFVWTLKYPKPYRLSLHENSKIVLYHNGVKISTWQVKDRIKGNARLWSRKEGAKQARHNSNKRVAYSSMQIGFPESFGLEKSFNTPLTPEDSSSLQIKGVLSTFDLIISRFIAQLEKAYSLLNNEAPNLTEIARDVLEVIPGIEFIWLDFNQKYQAVGDGVDQRFNAWKSYLKDQKNNLHELVSNTHRVEADYLETQINTHRFLLGLMGFELNTFDRLANNLSYETEAQQLKALLDYWLKNRLFRIHAQSHQPNSLERDAQNGFAGLISHILGLEFDTQQFTQGIEKITQIITHKNGNKLFIYKTFDEIIRWGRNKQAYTIDDESRQTKIRNHKNESIAEFEHILNDFEVQETIDKLNTINDLSTGFLLVEHFEFAPSIDEPVFGLHIRNQHRYLIDIEPQYTLSALYESLAAFEKALQEKSYTFEIKKIAHRQYINVFQAAGFYHPIQGFYASEAQALRAQHHEDWSLSQVYYEFFDQQFFKNSFNTDPYSFAITLCFPDWNEHYWGNARKRKIQSFIDSITPPHIVTNVKWLNALEMHEVIQSIQRYHNQKTRKNAQPLRQRLFALLN